MMLEGHIPDGSDFLQRIILRIRHNLMSSLFMNITTLPVSRLDIFPVADLHPVLDYLLKIFFYNTSMDNNGIIFAQSIGPGDYRHP